jgi:hypothetical protein
MFRASLCPSSGAYQLQQQPLVYRRNVVVAVILVVVGPAGQPARPRPTVLLPPRSNGNPEAAALAVDRLLMMGRRIPETSWTVFNYDYVFSFYIYDYVFSLYVYVWLHWPRFFRAFSSVVRQMPGQNLQRRSTASTVPSCCVVLCIFVLFYVFSCCSTYCLFCDVPCIVVCTCVLNTSHQVATQLHLNISYQTTNNKPVINCCIYLVDSFESDLLFTLQVDVKHNIFYLNTSNFRIFTQLLYHIPPIVTSITLLYNLLIRNVREFYVNNACHP